MRAWFGSAQDGPQIAGDTPNTYEWWYFDALSDDNRYALVVIFFHGTPMSPYYARVTDGKNPLPGDWCAVFATLHERTKSGWRERAYAYNLYPNGDFTEPLATVGDSRMTRTPDGWNTVVAVPGLWGGTVRADLLFTDVQPGFFLPPLGEPEEPHTWICAAPCCRVRGEIGGIVFQGTGYHDHNFGTLPFNDTRLWYWGRAHFSDCTLVFYANEAASGHAVETRLLFTDADQAMVTTGVYRTGAWRRTAYGLVHADWLHFADVPNGGTLDVVFSPGSALSESPFYRRRTFTAMRTNGALRQQHALGIGEIFAPGRLSGPIVRHALWSRLRRRRLRRRQ